MPQQEVISPVTARTEWCAGIVPVRKPNDSVRICVDLTQPNKAAQREIHPIPLLDENLAKLGDGNRFYKLDANSGFWQIPLDAKSKLLTTFVTPFGCFCFIRPHLVSAPLQRSSNVRGPRCLRAWRRPSVRWMMSSLTGWASQNAMDADERNHQQEAELTLNDKCEFSRCAIRFLTYIIDSSELHANPQKTLL